MTELKMLRPADLLKATLDQKEHYCVLDPNGSCHSCFKYKGFGFCVSELSGQGCQAENTIAVSGATDVVHEERGRSPCSSFSDWRSW
jgi:hypothetical protein